MPDKIKVAGRGVRSAKTILLAEGQGLRKSVSHALRTSGYHVVVAATGREALQLALDFKGPIHMLVANVEMPDMTGIELAQKIGRERPDSDILLISSLDAGMLILNKGWCFLPTPFAPDMLLARIREILKEPDSVAKEQSPPNDAQRGREKLTKREIEVLKLIAAGHSTKRIADILGMAFKTCVGHRTRLMNKLDIHDSVSLVRYAIRAGHSDL